MYKYRGPEPRWVKTVIDIKTMYEQLSQELIPYLRRLETVLENHRPLVVAFSGGVDSALLAYAAHQVLGADMKCVIAVSPSLARTEEKDAAGFLEKHGIPFLRIDTREMENDGYRANTADRCYYCKSELFSTIENEALESERGWIAYGANVDDLSDHRPGARAAAEKRVIAPLVEAGYTKDVIRRTAREFGLDVWDKPAAPCLASRIPYDSEVTTEKLRQVEAAESVLRQEGFRVCRVRHHGGLARVEVPLADHARLTAGEVWERVVEGIKAAGFLRVELEADGFRSGRLNDALNVDPGLDNGS